MSRAEPRYMGGQAVLEGVMMRGASTWAVAVRDPDGDDQGRRARRPGLGRALPQHPGPARRHRVSASRSASATARSPGRRTSRCPPRSRSPRRSWAGSVGVAAIVFSALFIVLPALAGRSLGHLFHGSFPIVEGVARLGDLRRVPARDLAACRDIRRVFEYHGAEHKAIAAYENGVELTPETAQQFSTAHVRCGTNFLLTVMVVAILVYSVIPRPNLLFVIGSRVVLVPRDRGAQLRGDPPRRRGT